MVDILIIEDNIEKRESIISAIKEINESLNPFIIAEDCINLAKKQVEDKSFDIVIIDLVIPLRSNEEASPQNCCNFLEDLETSPFLNPPLFVVGLTQFKELNDKYSAFFEERLYHLLEYELNSTAWKSKLKKIIYHLHKIKSDFISPTEFRYKYDAIFITALYKPEHEAILGLSDNWTRITHEDDPTIYYETTLSGDKKDKKIVAVFADQMGMVACAALTTKVIMKFHPKYVIMTGITAGVKKEKVNYGDILISDLCWDYNSGKIIEFATSDTDGNQNFTTLKFEPDPKSIPLKNTIKTRLLEFSNNKQVLFQIRNDWKGVKIENDLLAHVGPLSSGSQVIASSNKMNEIKAQNRKLIGIEMEAYGLFYATNQIFESKVTPIVIKSICDFGDEQKDDRFHEYAAYTSAQFAKRFLLEYL